MSFTYENQGNNTYLVYKIGASDNVDTMSLGMITNNKIDGIVPTLFTQSDTDRFIKYNISAKVSAKEFLSGVVNKKRLLGVFISVLKAIKSTEEYMIDARSLLIDLEHIYVDVSKCDAMLVCLPLVRQNESVNIPMFFKQIMFSTQFDQNENCDYVAQIINYLNSTPVFSVDAFEKLLMDIDADNLNIAASKAVVGQQKPVQPQSQSQSQQPKPMQPAMNQLKNAQVQTNMPSQGKMQSQRETQSANNVVQPNQVNFAVPNMNPQNQNRINNNVQMGTNISGTYVETTSEKQMSMFGLLTHYSKENKQIYERQKAQRKVISDMSGDELTKYLNGNDGKIKFKVPEGVNQQVAILCADCSIGTDGGTNTTDFIYKGITVSSNAFILFFENKPLFYGVLGVVAAAIIAPTGFVIYKKKRKTKKEASEQ